MDAATSGRLTPLRHPFTALFRHGSWAYKTPLPDLSLRSGVHLSLFSFILLGVWSLVAIMKLLSSDLHCTIFLYVCNHLCLRICARRSLYSGFMQAFAITTSQISAPWVHILDKHRRGPCRQNGQRQYSRCWKAFRIRWPPVQRVYINISSGFRLQEQTALIIVAHIIILLRDILHNAKLLTVYSAFWWLRGDSHP